MVHYQAPLVPIRGPQFYSRLLDEEQRSLEFFVHRTVLQLSGPFLGNFWGNLVLQAAHAHPPIMHAVVALGAFHERFEKFRYLEPQKNEFPLRQYGKAIQGVRELTRVNSHGNIAIALIASILFTACECIQGHFQSAIMHVKGGVELLSQWSGQEQSDLLPLLYTLMIRLDTQSLELGGMMADSVDQKHIYPTLSPLPSTFLSVVEAYSAFDALYNKTLFFLSSMEAVSDFESPIWTKLANYFDAWCTAFDNADFPESVPGVLILKIHQQLVHVLHRIEFTAGETAWDRFTPELESIVTYTEILTRTSPTLFPSDKPLTRLPTLTMGLGQICPLYIVGTRCRDPSVRRQAHNLLASHDRIEGAWDSQLVARIVHKIIEKEEGAVGFPVTKASQIPEEARISHLEIRLVDRRANISYCRGRGAGDGDWELLEW